MKRIKKWMYGLITLCVACLCLGIVSIGKQSTQDVTASAAFASSYSGGNLLVDGDFSSGTFNNWTGWHGDPANQPRVIENGSAKLAHATESSETLSQKVTLTKGKKYYFSVDFWAVGIANATSTGEGLYLEIQQSDKTIVQKKGFIGGSSVSSFNSSTWVTYVGEFVATDTSYDFIVRFYGATGTAYVDNLYLGLKPLDYGSTSKWVHLSQISTSDNGLIPTAQTTEQMFGANTSDFEANSTLTITSDFTNSGATWGLMVYLFKWNNGTDAANIFYKAGGENYPNDYDANAYKYFESFSNEDATAGLYFHQTAGDWLALVMSNAYTPFILECRNGQIVKKTFVMDTAYLGPECGAVMKGKTEVKFSSVDTSSGVEVSFSFDAIDAGNISPSVRTLKIDNPNLKGASSLYLLKIRGNTSFNGSCPINITARATSNADQSHWVDGGTMSYPKDFSDGSFTLVGIGDPQMFTKNGGSLYTQMYEWIAANKTAFNMKYAVNVGDTVDYALDANQWTLAKNAHQLLQNVNLPYVLTMGNHDYEGYWEMTTDEYGNKTQMPRKSDKFDATFPYADYVSWLGSANFGTLDSTQSKMRNTWHKFTNGNDKYLIISLEYGVTAATVAQAAAVIEANADYNVIISTHSYLNGDTSYNNDGAVNLKWDGGLTSEQLWNTLISKHSNIFMVLCGHTDSYGLSTKVAYGDAGNPIMQVKIDAQGTFDDQESLVALFKIKSTSVQTYYYSVSSGRYYNGSNFSIAPVVGTTTSQGGGFKLNLGEIVQTSSLINMKALDGGKQSIFGAPTSSNMSVASIDANGRIMAKGLGTTTITYTLSGRGDSSISSGVLTTYTTTIEVVCPHVIGDTNGDHRCETCGLVITDHVFDQKVASETYVKAWATCFTPDIFYYSCACGAKGTQTFESGAVLDHEFTRKVVEDAFKKSDATCTSPALYYYSCICGTAGSETFTVGDAGTHYDANSDHNCDTCNKALTYCEDRNNDLFCDVCRQGTNVYITFKGANISIQNNIHILYAVNAKGLTPSQVANMRVLVWKTAQDSYVYGTHDAELISTSSMTYDYISYPVFTFNDLSIRRMTDDVYARVYIPSADGMGYYSETLKYSILEYAYAKLGKTDREGSEDENLITVVEKLLKLGESMQIYQSYNLDRLATDDYVYVKIKNATFDDGVSTGLYKPGTQLNVTLDSCCAVASGNLPSYLSVDGSTITLTVPDTMVIDTTSFTYTVYGPSPMNDSPAQVLLTTEQTFAYTTDNVVKAVENVNENYVSVTMQRPTSSYYGININLTGNAQGWNGGVIFSYTQDRAHIRIDSAGSSGIALFILDIPTNFAENKAGTLVYKWTALMSDQGCIGLQLDLWYGVDGVYTKVGLQEVRNDTGTWNYDGANKSFTLRYDVVEANMLAPDCTIMSYYGQNGYGGATCDWTISSVSVSANKPNYLP